ncbi:MAG: sortase A [Halioglobus sp.]|jgi:sortase A
MFRRLQLDNWRAVSAVCFALIGFQQIASAGYIQGKAHLAQYLIGRAWEQSLQSDGAPVKPWPWADTWPVAKMNIPQQSLQLYVLAGATGNALAFGPGHESASAPLGQPGLSLIGGHSDTHFGFLKSVDVDGIFFLELPTGENIRYEVTNTAVVNINLEPVPSSQGSLDELLLVTCYPFDSLASGPLRYLVQARPA